MTDQNGALEIKRFDQRRGSIGVGIKVVPLPRLARSAVVTTIMGETQETA